MGYGKRIVALLLGLLCLLGAFLPVSAEETTTATEEKIVIVLDPGHGGYDGGTDKGARAEKVYALLVGQYLYEALSADDRFEVILTRDDDTYLRILPRVLVAKEHNADLILSLHFNSLSETYVNGSMAYCSVVDRYDAGALAGSILDAISRAVDLKRGKVDYVADTGDSLGIYYWNEEKQWDMPGAWQLGKKSDYYSICTWASKFGIPSIILEHAYLSNPTDAALIEKDENLRAIAQAEADAIIEYFTGHTHSFGELERDFPSSCVMNGSASRRCSHCDMKIETTVLPADPDAHYWRQTASVAGNCLNPGYIDYVCQIAYNLNDKGYSCDVHTYRETITAGGHSYTVTEDRAAAHGVDGVHTEVCSRCGDTVTTTTPGEPHSYTVTETVAPTCQGEGYTRSACTICGDVIEEKQSAVGHSYRETEVLPATETADGYRDLLCDICGETKREILPACAHIFAGETVSAPTCTEAGLYRETCTLCGYGKEQILDPMGHDYEVQENRRANCTETGVYRGVCATCGQEINETYPALGHRDETVQESMLSRTLRCAQCGREETEKKSFFESAMPLVLVGILLVLIPVVVIGSMLYMKKRRQEEEKARRRRFMGED